MALLKVTFVWDEDESDMTYDGLMDHLIQHLGAQDIEDEPYTPPEHTPGPRKKKPR
jgi:hypothetical protein